jgi:hypothetical protein
MKLVWKVAV